MFLRRRARFVVALCALTIAALASMPQGTAPITAASEWQPINPGGGGWFERIEVGSDGTLIACSDLSGAYLSHDEGQSWRAVGRPHGLTVTHVAGAAFDPNDSTTMFLATEFGIFRSTNAGENFAHVLSNGFIEDIAVAASDPNLVYAAWHPQYDSNAGRIYKSTNGGVSWQAVSTGLPGNLRILELSVATDDPQTLYFMTGNSRFATGPARAYRSDDGGVSWTAISGSFGNLLVDLALDEFDSDILWASVDDADPDEDGHLYKSTNRGDQWTHVDQRGGFLWLHPQDAHTIRMVEARYQYPWDEREGIWESNQDGAPGSWVKKSSVSNWAPGWTSAFWTFNATSIHGGLAAHPNDPDVLYWVNTQFVYGTQDGGVTVGPFFTDEVGGSGSNRWRSRGFDNVVVMDLALNEANPDELYAGFFDLGTWRSLDAGASWTPLNHPAHTGGWMGAGGNTWSVLPDPARPGQVWAPQGGDVLGDHSLLRSSNSGDAWTVVGAGLPAAPLLGLSLDRHSPVLQRTLFLTAEGDVYRSQDGGVSWSVSLTNGGMRFTAVDHFDGDLVYAGGENGLWRSDSGGAPGSWTDVSLPQMLGQFSGEPFWGWEGVYDIEPAATHPNWVYVAAHGPGRGLYLSRDAGQSWDPRLLQDNHLRCIAVNPEDSLEIYATSSSAFHSGGYESDTNGVWRSIDGGRSWRHFNRGLDWPFAISIVIHPTHPSLLYLGSPGTGIHKRVLARPTPALGPGASK